MESIETKDLRRIFTSHRSETEAVAGINLSVHQGELFGFLGPNGAGKTTTLRMLSTLLRPSGGEAVVEGYDLLRDPSQVRKQIGYVGQRGGADERIVGRAELVTQGRLYGMSVSNAKERAAELIRILELESCADRVVKTYSGGQRRRLDIGIGLMHKPKLLFLDEPTTGLDPQSRAHVWKEVEHLRASGMTIFLTTHYLDEADALCDRLAIIDQGKIVAQGTPNDLKQQVRGDVLTISVDGEHAAVLTLLHKQPYVREIMEEDERLRLYVDRGETAMPALLRILDGAGYPLRTMSLTRPSLDDVFLHQTGRSLREEKQ